MAILSDDGKKVLNNYDRFTGVPFNGTIVTKWYDGSVMDDTKVDNIIYFKNPENLKYGYTKRDYEGPIDASWAGVVGSGNISDAISNRLAINKVMVLASLLKATVELPRGVIYVEGGSIQIQSDITLRGKGRYETIILKTDNTSTPFLNTTSKSNFTVEHIGFNGGTQTANSVSLQFNACFNFTVRSCFFTNMKNALWLNSISPLPCHDFNILYNDFGVVTDFGIRAKENLPYKGLIVGNTFENVLQGVATGEASAIRLSGIDIIVANNIVRNTIDTGIMFTQCVNCTADNNIISSRLVGIFAGTNSKGLKVVNNTITSELDFGIHAYNPSATAFVAGGVYTGNKIYNTGKSGMYFDASIGNTITGNNVLNPGRRIGVEDREKCGINLGSNISKVRSTNNTVTGNIVIDDLTNQRMKYGIFEESATSDNIIAGNVVIGSTGDNVRSTTNTFGIESTKVRQSSISYEMSLALGVGEVTTSTRPDIAIYGRNKLLYDTTINQYVYSNGINWIPLGNSQNVNADGAPQFVNLTIDNASGSNRSVVFSTLGSRRFAMRCNNGAETGSNAGSDFNFIAYSDADAVIGTVFTIVRGTLEMTIPNLLSLTAAVGASNTKVATTAFVQNEIASRTVIDTTATPYTKATINTIYPNAKIGFRVIADVAGFTYTKKDNSTTGNWSSRASTQLA